MLEVGNIVPNSKGNFCRQGGSPDGRKASGPSGVELQLQKALREAEEKLHAVESQLHEAEGKLAAAASQAEENENGSRARVYLHLCPPYASRCHAYLKSPQPLYPSAQHSGPLTPFAMSLSHHLLESQQ